MRNIIITAALLALVLCSCTQGPIYVAKGEADSVKRSYNDRHVQSVFDKNASLFKDIYNRYSSDNVGIYQDGIGVATLEDFDKQKLHYVMIYVRPKDAAFDMNTTKPDERIARIIRDFVPRYIKNVRPSDLDGDDIEGLAFGIYWAARDHSQCDKFGGHIEYVYIFFPEDAAKAYLEGKLSFAEAVDQSEVMSSTNLEPAKPIRPVF